MSSFLGIRKLVCFVGLLLVCSSSIADGPKDPPLRVEEEDGSPSSIPVFKIEVPNGTLTQDDATTVSLDYMTQTTGDARYLKLDASNDPLTGALNMGNYGIEGISSLKNYYSGVVTYGGVIYRAAQAGNTKSIDWVNRKLYASDGTTEALVWDSTPTVTNLIDSGLTASKAVFTDSNKQLTSTGIGTSSQFIKGDGSLDATTYLDTTTAASTYLK